MVANSISEEDIQSIIEARHNAPHTLLGPHPGTAKSAIVIRAFLPHARQVQMLRQGSKPSRKKMQKIHPEGLFEATFFKVDAAFRYRLKVTEQEGSRRVFDDPYAFLPETFEADDIYRFARGTHYRIFEKLGAHIGVRDGIGGVNFAVWAPHAERVSVVGVFNRWDGRCHPMFRHGESGVWELFIPGLNEGALYKYEVRAPNGDVFLKTDPYAFAMEAYPKTAAIVCGPDKHTWRDGDWMEKARQTWDWPVSIYKPDEAAWRRVSDKETGWLSYREFATEMVPSLKEQGFTHLELSPPQPPFDRNRALYAPNAQHGEPQDLMALVDTCHQHGIGIILNWTAYRFPDNAQELAWFDGAPLYERTGREPVTGNRLFDQGRPEVSNFLIANALFWVRYYHVDGLRTDAAGSLLFLDYLEKAYRVFAPVKLLVKDHEQPSSLSPEEIDKIVQVRHPNPHEVLGPHRLDQENISAVRAFLPDAEQAYIIRMGYPKLLYRMIRHHEAGFFETRVAARSTALSYRIHGIDKEGKPLIGHDPYAFLPTAFTEDDIYRFGKGTHYRVFEKLGAHSRVRDGVPGVNFAVWAPRAERVSVVGEFNDWEGSHHVMSRHGESGVWELFIPSLSEGTLYKYEIRAPGGEIFLKTDPYAFYTAIAPEQGSRVYRLENKHHWRDNDWLRSKAQQDDRKSPMAIYEVHLGSWMRAEDNGLPSYRQVTETLIPYVKRLGFTHIELMPIAEHPYEPSWGYQITNFFAPSSRYGRPEDLMALVDACHQNGIGVILDWVPAHFPKDVYALARFDGSSVYEHADPRRGEHPDWGTLIFDYGRQEVENFLVANALFWLNTYHFDALRVDAVASMLYLDYSRPSGEWVPNVHGGNENLEAIEFIKHLNTAIAREAPQAMVIAEESTSWPKVSRPVEEGGLGFDFKWNMGWMHDVLVYLANDPIYRQYHHDKLIFSLVYAFDENFILSLSHDEVVHLKGSLITKMPGDETQKFANLRLLYTYMYTHPGKKLLFMGGEFAQLGEWNFARSLEWALLEQEPHQRLQYFVGDLNRLYRTERALHEVDFDPAGFEWIDAENADQNVIAFIRRGKDPRNCLFMVLNFSGATHENYRFGVPFPGFYQEKFNSDAEAYGGEGRLLAPEGILAEEIPCHGRPFSLALRLPALSAIILKPLPPETEAKLEKAEIRHATKAKSISHRQTMAKKLSAP